MKLESSKDTKLHMKGDFEAELKLIPQEEGGIQEYGLKEELKLKFKENVTNKIKVEVEIELVILKPSKINNTKK